MYRPTRRRGAGSRRLQVIEPAGFVIALVDDESAAQRGVFGAVNLWPPQERLGDRFSEVHGQRGHPDVDAEVGHRLVPRSVLKVEVGKFARETEIAAASVVNPPSA